MSAAGTGEDEPSDFKPLRLKMPLVYYDVGRKDYWLRNDREDWITVNETSLKRQLRACGYGMKIGEGESMSKLDQALNTIQLKFDVAYAGPLAGYQKGPTDVCGQRILVTTSPKLIIPAQGKFPVLQQLLNNLFRENQLPYVLGWLKVAYECLREGCLRPGQMLVMAGERNSGKSLFQKLITEILGGRAAKPYRYMYGGTDFNGDLFWAEHLMIEDEVPSNDFRSRRAFGTKIKEFTVNEVQSCHAKNRQAISLKPFWRVSASLNDEPENLQILPPFDESISDKIILLRVFKERLPMPTFTSKERNAFWQTLVAELPAFLWYLSEWKIPEELKCERFGIRHFHHPELVEALEELTPEAQLLALIDFICTTTVEYQGGFEGTAEELQNILFNSLQGYEAKRLLVWPTATATYLGRLAKKHPTRVVHMRTATRRGWKITPPP